MIVIKQGEDPMPSKPSFFEITTLTVQVIGTVLIIVSLRYVGAQTRTVSDSLKSGIYGSVGNQILEIDKVFISDPTLRPYFYSGKDIAEDDPLYNKVASATDLILDIFDIILAQKETSPEAFPAGTYREWIKGTFATSPIMCKQLESRKGWYNDELYRLMKEGEASQKVIKK